MLQQTTCSKQQWQQLEQQQQQQQQQQQRPQQRQQQQQQPLQQQQQQQLQQQQQQEQQTAKAQSSNNNSSSSSSSSSSNCNNNNSKSNSNISNMVFSNMLLPASNSTTTTIDFNSRRRRGRLRDAHKCCQLVPATSAYVANTQQQQQEKQKQPQQTNKHDANKLLLTIMCDCVNILKRLVLLTLNATTTKTTTTTTTKTKYNDKQKGNTPTLWGGRGQSLCCMLPLLLLCLLLCSAEAHKPKSATQHKQQQQQQLEQQQQREREQEQQQAAHSNDVTFNNNVGGVAGVPPTYQVKSSQTSNEDEAEILYQSAEMFGEEEDEALEGLGGQLNTVHGGPNDEDNAANQRGINETLTDSSNTTKTPLFPKDLFTKEQLENGAVILHIIGVIYMFVALAIVCDEFFVPSLDVIIEKLGITDDVAGATFMAAGGSAPELFTSVIGVFVSFDDVGIGTIVGSAVFNILFVIGMCALFSRTVLSLTWWPLFRDCSFYSISLLVLIYFFRDNRIFWWEALILFTIYIAYVTFMKWNVQVEHCVKKMITKNKVTRVRSTDQLMPAGNAANSSETSMATQPGGSVTSRAASETRSGPAGSSNAGATGNSSGGTAGSTQTGAKFRHGLLQLMIHTIDPLHDDDVPGKVDEKATQLHAIASLKVLLDATKPQRGGATTSAANHVKINLKETTLADRPNGNIDTTLDSAPEIIDDDPEPLSMAWPDTARKRLTYVLVAPLLVPMWLTLPDTRTPRGKRYFPVTFIGSIVWIAAFSYLMVWWANVAGDTARIPPEVMGLTFLAAGTSIPDLITSVIVARKGFGDMAVSSSVGSNIFDVTVGLPIPWLIYGIIYDAPVEVNSVGMVCSITILFMMLVFVVLSIACFRWRMNKGLGFTMFLLYFVFVAVSLMFEYDLITCPV